MAGDVELTRPFLEHAHLRHDLGRSADLTVEYLARGAVNRDDVVWPQPSPPHDRFIRLHLEVGCAHHGRNPPTPRHYGGVTCEPPAGREDASRLGHTVNVLG